MSLTKPGARLAGRAPLIALAMAILSTTACTSPSPPPQQQLVDSKTVIESFHHATQSFPKPLPAGYRYPPSGPTGLDPQEKYDYWLGDYLVAIYWQCAWMHEYIDADTANDRTTAQSAVDVLATWRDIPFVAEYIEDDPVASYHDALVEPARAGDAAPFAAFYEGNMCDSFLEPR